MPRTLSPSLIVVREGASGDNVGDDGGGSVIDEHEEAERIVEEAEKASVVDVDEPLLCEPCGSDEATTEPCQGYKSPHTPCAPSRQERAEHAVAHCPFRSWCAHCVMGKAKAKPHFMSTPKVKDETAIPLVGVDYAFMSNTNAEDE